MSERAASRRPGVAGDRGVGDAPEPRDEAITRWWTRNLVGRELTDVEWRFLGDTAVMLDDLAPRQVDPALCAVTHGGRSTLIALIPHRSLGGLTLAITVTERFATISWTSIHDLASHDDLDLTREVYLFGRDEDEDAMWRAAVAGLREQLSRRFILRIRSTRSGIPLSASCHLAGGDGRLRRIARLPARMGWGKRFWRWSRTSNRELSFVDVSPPPYAVPSRASVWFRGD
ncbi:MAG: hypothetical protein ABI634_04235 [Acidobacteriota bacterium]